MKNILVTGTNGKTTTITMIAAIVEAEDKISAAITTTKRWVGSETFEAESGFLAFENTLAAAKRAGVKTFAVEVTSHGLELGFAQIIRPDVGVFTNLSHDHLDHHQTLERYLAAKAQLFLALTAGTTAILNADDVATDLLEEVIDQQVDVRHFSRSKVKACLCAHHIEISPSQTIVHLHPSPLADALGGQLQVNAVGAHFGLNAMAAALATSALGYSPASIKAGIANFTQVPGRFEVVHKAPLVVVDYAHTPSALENTLKTARDLLGTEGRLFLVFGCGGGRDPQKRPVMGEIAERLADVIVVTNDNPRHESPQRIVEEIKGGFKEVTRHREQLDRRLAIEECLAQAQSIDLVLVTGKGHEEEQVIGDISRPFSDAQVIVDFFHR